MKKKLIIQVHAQNLESCPTQSFISPIVITVKRDHYVKLAMNSKVHIESTQKKQISASTSLWLKIGLNIWIDYSDSCALSADKECFPGSEETFQHMFFVCQCRKDDQAYEHTKAKSGQDTMLVAEAQKTRKEVKMAIKNDRFVFDRIVFNSEQFSLDKKFKKRRTRTRQ